jgi:high-affinity iron transporter
LRIILIMVMTHTAVAYFFYSLGILFREGMEAMLVIVALATGTVRSRRSTATRDVYVGAGLAIVASVILAWAVNHLISDDASDTLEGIFQIFAAATLFYVSSWLTSKGQSDRWMHFINRKLESADSSAVPAIALGLTAFLAVMREGAETIVFFQALTNGATESVERHALAAGVVVAVVALAIAFVLMKRAANRIPVGIFFRATSLLLYGLAIVFIGQGVASLQEASIVPATFVDYAPQIPMLGIFPTVQTLGAQAFLLILAGAALLAPRPDSNRRLRAEQRSSAGVQSPLL